MHGSRCFGMATGLALLLLIACTSESPPPAATPATANESASAQADIQSATELAAPATATANTGLAGSNWQLVRFQGGDGTVLAPDDASKYTLQFGADGNVSVRLDCNRGRSAWKEPQAGTLELGPMALTRAACPPGSMHDQVARQWTHIRSYVIRDGHLFLALMADGGIYEFAPMTATARTGIAGSGSTAALTNTYWKLITLDGAQAQSPPGAREIHLILQIDQQRVAGFSGCNRLMGSYRLDGARLSFSQMAGTMMACPPPGMEVERNVHGMLQKVAQWRVDGEKLMLMDDSGAVLAEFESRYMQ